MRSSCPACGTALTESEASGASCPVCGSALQSSSKAYVPATGRLGVDDDRSLRMVRRGLSIFLVFTYGRFAFLLAMFVLRVTILGRLRLSYRVELLGLTLLEALYVTSLLLCTQIPRPSGARGFAFGALSAALLSLGTGVVLLAVPVEPTTFRSVAFFDALVAIAGTWLFTRYFETTARYVQCDRARRPATLASKALLVLAGLVVLELLVIRSTSDLALTTRGVAILLAIVAAITGMVFILIAVHRLHAALGRRLTGR